MRITFIVGSVRKGSFNLQLSRIAEEIVGSRAEICRMDISSIPFMDQDNEFPAPDAVASARKMVMGSDAVWFFTPEYNRSIPGALKNATDWLSRPLDPSDPDRISAMTGKKAIISGVGGGKRTEFSRRALSEVLAFIGMEIIGGEGEGFSLDRRAFTENIWEPGKEVRSALKKQADLLLDSI